MAKNQEVGDKKVSSIEKELEALQVIVDAIKELDEGAQARVFGYIKDRFRIYVPS